MMMACEFCGCEFAVKPYLLKPGARRFCSRRCFGQAQRDQAARRRLAKNPPLMQHCTKCGQEKAISEFYVHKPALGTLHGACKTCFDQQTKARVDFLKRNPPTPPESKCCPQCGIQRLRTDFYTQAGRSDGLAVYCKTCQAQRQQRSRAKHKEAIKAKARQWRLGYRQRALEHYGGAPPQCACCGETALAFLVIDHINGGGRRHRQQVKASSLYSWLEKHGYPDGFRVLCANCNHAYGIYGTCPHTQP